MPLNPEQYRSIPPKLPDDPAHPTGHGDGLDEGGSDGVPAPVNDLPPEPPLPPDPPPTSDPPPDDPGGDIGDDGGGDSGEGIDDKPGHAPD